MDRLIYIAMTGAKHTMGQQAAVAHNLANVSSTGYRAEEHRLRAVPVRSEALPTRAFVVDTSHSTNFDAGPLQHTGRALDVAVQDKGWLTVQAADGSEGYTRNGSLEVSVNGVLQTRGGLPVVGDGGPVSIPPNAQVTIGEDGTISVVAPGSAKTVSAVGRLKLVNPPEADLERSADGLFRVRDGGTAEADPKVRVAGGYLEGSNVNVVEQMVTMIALARQFDLQTKMLETAEADDRTATQLLSPR